MLTGSRSYFTGSGFTWDAVSNTFTNGVITGIKHFKDGLYIDEITGLIL